MTDPKPTDEREIRGYVSGLHCLLCMLAIFLFGWGLAEIMSSLGVWNTVESGAVGIMTDLNVWNFVESRAVGIPWLLRWEIEGGIILLSFSGVWKFLGRVYHGVYKVFKDPVEGLRWGLRPVEDFRWGLWEVTLWGTVLLLIFAFLMFLVIIFFLMFTGEFLIGFDIFILIRTLSEFNIYTLIDKLLPLHDSKSRPGLFIELTSTVFVLFLSLLGTYLALVGLKNRIYTTLMSGNIKRLVDILSCLPGPQLLPKINIIAETEPTFHYSGEVDVNQSSVELSKKQPNLVYIRIIYNDGDPNSRKSLLRPIFPEFRWWIHLPDGYKFLRRSDAEEDGYNTTPDCLYHNSLSNEIGNDNNTPSEDENIFATSKVLVNENSDEGGAYDNLAYGYLESKQFILTQNRSRGEVSYFGTGHNKRIHIPLWIIPKYEEYTDSKIRVAINATEYPHYQEKRDIEINLS